MSNYELIVKGKTAEEILSSERACDAGLTVSAYLQVAAQVRSNEELIAELKRASIDNERMTRQIFYLTAVLAAAGVAQVIATAWPYLGYWWHH